MVEIALRQRTVVPPPTPEPQHAPAPAREAPEAASRRPRRRLARLGARIEGLAMLGALATAMGTVGADYQRSLADPTPIAGVRLGGLAVGGLDPEARRAVASAAVQSTLDRPLRIRAGEVELVRTRRALGAVPVLDDVDARIVALGRSGDVLDDLATRVRASTVGIDVPVGHRFDDARALDELLALAPAVERPSLPTRLDLERRRVEPARPGAALLAHDALSAVAVGLAAGVDTLDLPVQTKPPVADDPLAAYADLDIGTVLGSFETPYQLDAASADRTFNLKVGATKLAGAVIMPGEVFSFNDRVGARDSANGFRYGGGITAGEMVDVLGGGICQVSSTIYGAAFFAGLDVVEHRPHSRPSAYVDMGLDATVVWPDVDLRLRNPYDFPVVLQMVVRQGKVHAEVLGARRPYQVAFERDLVESIPYRTIYRDDSSLRAGSQVVSQRGMRGFKVKRTRKIYQAGDLVREDVGELSYPSTTEILKRGTSPSGAMPETKPMPPLRDPAPHLRIVQ